MAQLTKNSVESIGVSAPPPKYSHASSPSPSPSSSSSSSSSSPSNSIEKSCVRCIIVSENESNFKRSASPVRLMRYQNGSWIDFSTEVIDSIQSNFLEGKPMAVAVIEGSKYLFDFLRMLLIDFNTGNQQSIAWIDENGNCFFPKLFITGQNVDYFDKSEHDTTKIEIEINVSGNFGKRVREGIEKDDEVSSQFVSKRQRLITNGVDSSRWPNARLLKETERAYTLVRDYFLSGIKKIDAGATITSIHKCTHAGQLERARFELFQKQIEVIKATRGASNTVYAWYGVSASGVKSILAHGFGVPSKISTYGTGVYLSPVLLPGLSAKLAEADQNGEKHVVLCRVILGNVEKVEAGSKQCFPSGVDFDSGSDDPNRPNWYVVWPSNVNRHIIPECVVSYKPSGHVQGQFGGTTCAKYPLEKLFTMMKNSLSSSKLQEVINLYHTYKAGKMAKDYFFKQLRLVAGDEMLLSTIREIRASE